MDVKQSLFTAVSNLLANRPRFLHAMLGMVTGVAAVVFILGIASPLRNLLQLESNEYAPDMLMTFVMNNADSTRPITADDILKLAEDRPELISAISPYVNFEMEGGLRYESDNIDESFILGVNEQYLEVEIGFLLKEGRFLEHMDMARENRVCVIGQGVADKIAEGDALGKTLKIWGENYTVVGIVNNKFNDTYHNAVVFIPYTNAKKMTGNVIRHNGTAYTYYQERYFIVANGTENMYDAQLAIEELCREITGREEGSTWLFSAYSARGTIEQGNDFIFGTIFQFMILAAIVLFIGGVGVMNVMLAAVSARTQEIGIRKAFGATNEDIQRQFGLEAVITSLLGGLLGIVLGLIATFFAGIYMAPVNMGDGVMIKPDLSCMDLPFIPVLVALAVSVGVGVLFGTYPAKQAAKMEIVDAINSD